MWGKCNKFGSCWWHQDRIFTYITCGATTNAKLPTECVVIRLGSFDVGRCRFVFPSYDWLGLVGSSSIATTQWLRRSDDGADDAMRPGWCHGESGMIYADMMGMVTSEVELFFSHFLGRWVKWGRGGNVGIALTNTLIYGYHVGHSNSWAHHSKMIQKISEAKRRIFIDVIFFLRDSPFYTVETFVPCTSLRFCHHLDGQKSLQLGSIPMYLSVRQGLVVRKATS